MSDELVRSFVAVELPDQVKSMLQQLLTRLSARIAASLGPSVAGQALKWVDSGGVHITLKFLGSVPSARLIEIEDALGRSVSGKPPLTLELSGLGAFPNVRNPRVLWIGLRGQLEELASIQSALDSELDQLGFPAETRPFNPHVTLARLRETASAAEKRKIGEVISSSTEKVQMRFPVTEISLMRSQLTRAGAHYTRIASAALR